VEIVFLIVVVSGGLVAAVAVRHAGKRQRHAALSQIASVLGGQGTATAAFGVRHGTSVRVELVTRGAGKSKEEWTVIDAAVPDAYPLAIHVRRQRWLDVSRIAHGGVVDLPLGDARFDEAFLVEAAPEDIVRALLDASARDFLLRFQRVELDTVSVADFKVLRLAIRGWIEDAPSAIDAIDFLVRLGVRLRDVYLAIDGAAPARMVGSPYRPQPDHRPAREVPAARSVEVAALEAMRARRALRYKIIAVVVFVALLVFGLVVLPNL
jgi:hypothetical protein